MIVPYRDLDTSWSNPAVWNTSEPQVHLTSRLLAPAHAKVLSRDGNACRFCSFRSTRHQEIHHLDLNPKNHSIENLVTACQFCHACFHIGFGIKNKLVSLIHMPEVTQVQLNHILRAAYIALRLRDGSPAEEASQHLMSVLHNREQMLNQFLGGKSGAAVDFAELMSRCPQVMREKFLSRLEGMRVLCHPRRLINGKIEIIDGVASFWTSNHGPFGAVPARDWFSIWQEIKGKLA